MTTPIALSNGGDSAWPLVILAVGMATVLGLILVARLNAFFALIVAALAVSLLADGEATVKVSRVAEAFGNTAGKIGIAIALAAVIGACMLKSGAADRVAQAFLRLFGERRGATSLSASGFLLSIPVFFDTVFYLLVPLAKSMHGRTGRHYVKYLLAIGAGGAVTHNLIPPTPGPIAMAEYLSIDLGTMMLIGTTVALPAALAGLAYAGWIDRRLVLAEPPELPEHSDDEATPEDSLPSLAAALTPIVLPIALIVTNTVLRTMSKPAPGSSLETLQNWAAVLGNPNMALLLAAAAALIIFVRERQPGRQVVSATVEGALMSAGIIILITSAGGAFGGMLKAAGVDGAIADLFPSGGEGGVALLCLAFLLTSLLKFAQGSSTVAVTTGSSMVAAMTAELSLSYHPVYLAMAVGCGAMVGSWMNDSGFWIYCQMGGLTEKEALKTWTPMLAITGIAGMLATVVLAIVLPLN